MGTLYVNPDELANVLQDINLIKVKFREHDDWFILPVLYASEGILEVIINCDVLSEVFQKNKELVFKFQRQGFEYIVEGCVNHVNYSKPATMEIKIETAQKYYNLRKFMRFDTELNINVDVDLEKATEELLVSKQDGIVKNISNGGVMIFSDVEISMNEKVNMLISLKSSNLLQCLGRIMRATKGPEGDFCYGIEFLKIDEENQKVLEKEIHQLESSYLKSLNTLREYIKKKDMEYDTKIVIFSKETDKSIEIRESLIKKGAENFTLFTEFTFYAEFFEIEQPKIIIIDSSNLENQVCDFVKKVKENLSEVIMILIMPMEVAEDERINDIKSEKTTMMFRPLIYNEFNEEIIKHL